LTFRWLVGLKGQIFFEKVDPMQPLRPKCSIENCRVLMLSLYEGLHQKVLKTFVLTAQTPLFLQSLVFHVRPSEVSFSSSKMLSKNVGKLIS